LYHILEEVIKVGATTLNIPDTVEYTLPYEFGKLISDIKENTLRIENAIISTHCQNGLGLATANTLAVHTFSLFDSIFIIIGLIFNRVTNLTYTLGCSCRSATVRGDY
jgi:hypothetical protein